MSRVGENLRFKKGEKSMFYYLDLSSKTEELFVPLGYNPSSNRFGGILNRVFKNPNEYLCPCRDIGGGQCDTPHQEFSAIINRNRRSRPLLVWSSGDCSGAYTGWVWAIDTAESPKLEWERLLSREGGDEFDALLYRANALLFNIEMEDAVEMRVLHKIPSSGRLPRWGMVKKQ